MLRKLLTCDLLRRKTTRQKQIRKLTTCATAKRFSESFKALRIAIYVANFSAPYSFLADKGLVTEEPRNHQFRFVDIIDPDSGANFALITGLASAIDVLPLREDGETVAYLALEYSLAHLAGGPGRLRIFDADGNPVAVLAGGLVTPSSMAYDPRTGSVIVAEINPGDLLVIPLP